jgi:hypothetical protein
MTANVTRNPLRDEQEWPPPTTIADFHRRMPAYSPTLLFDAPELAESLGLGRVLVKAETRRMGLPSFKILGASWATYQAICAHIGREPEPWDNINELAANLEYLKPFKLATATDGNHGRAVSFMARLLGFDAHIFVPPEWPLLGSKRWRKRERRSRSSTAIMTMPLLVQAKRRATPASWSPTRHGPATKLPLVR